jgi:hypothetical protein
MSSIYLSCGALEVECTTHVLAYPALAIWLLTFLGWAVWLINRLSQHGALSNIKEEGAVNG